MDKSVVVDNCALFSSPGLGFRRHTPHDRESNGHWAGHRGPVTVKPSELVSLFSSRVEQLLAEHEEGEEYERGNALDAAAGRF